MDNEAFEENSEELERVMNQALEKIQGRLSGGWGKGTTQSFLKDTNGNTVGTVDVIAPT